MNNHETHSCCNKRLQEQGGKAYCCYCVPHENCIYKNEDLYISVPAPDSWFNE